MKKKKKANSVTTMLTIILLLLLVSLSNVSIAENIPISQEGLKKIGLNKIRLESGIGVIVFNLSRADNKLIGEGYLTLSNTFNQSAIIDCKIITRLSPLDLDENGNPRTHEIISNRVIFEEMPDKTWLTLEDKSAKINPLSIYNFRYSVNIPITPDQHFDNDVGYLVYINVRKTLENATGANIGIDYSYKLFLIFDGELSEGLEINSFYLIPIPVVIVGIVFTVYRKKHPKIKTPKAPKKTPKPEINYTNNIKDARETKVEKPIAEREKISNKIDSLLEKKDIDKNRGKT